MTPEAFKAIQAGLELTNEEMARVMRVSLRTVETWRQGSRSVPGPAVVVLLLLGKYPSASKFLLGLTNKEAKK